MSDRKLNKLAGNIKVAEKKNLPYGCTISKRT